MKMALWCRSGSVPIRIPALFALLFYASTPGLFAAPDKPDAPVAKPDAIWDAQAAQANTSSPTQPAADKHAEDKVPKRILYIIPNFMTANDQPENDGPLSAGEKFNIAWHQFSDYSAHFGNILQASISQEADSIPHYGQGWVPFGERFLAMEGDQLSGSMLIYGALPAVLHEDPRYFRKGRGSSWSRIFYAASRVLIARTDAGNAAFNTPQVFGQLGQAAISLSYYPPQDRAVKGLFQGWGINQIYNVGWNQLKEFTPDLAAFLRRHHTASAQQPVAAAAN
jgi:hypothetical protein